MWDRIGCDDKRSPDSSWNPGGEGRRRGKESQLIQTSEWGQSISHIMMWYGIGMSCLYLALVDSIVSFLCLWRSVIVITLAGMEHMWFRGFMGGWGPWKVLFPMEGPNGPLWSRCGSGSRPPMGRAPLPLFTTFSRSSRCQFPRLFRLLLHQLLSSLATELEQVLLFLLHCHLHSFGQVAVAMVEAAVMVINRWEKSLWYQRLNWRICIGIEYKFTVRIFRESFLLKI